MYIVRLTLQYGKNDMLMFLKRKCTLIFCIILSGMMVTWSQITPEEAVTQMQKGINMGNTLEPPYETYWNNPTAKEYYFDLYRDAGFDCVRIPVRWDMHTANQEPYTVDQTWMDRVEEVVDWGLSRDLFIIINAHHDDWIKENYDNPDMRARFDSIWSQISVRFRDKSEKLIFEVLNEPRTELKGLTKAQNDDMHRRIISIIRKTNPTRLIIFQGNEWGGSDELIAAEIPDDDYVIGSFHSYDPYQFGLLGNGTWGMPLDYSTLENKFISVKNWSDANQVPVLLGEFGAVKNCDYNSRMKHYKAYVDFAQKYGFAYCVWDNGENYSMQVLYRAAKKWDEVKDILIHSTLKSPRNPKLSLLQDTIIHLNWSNVLADNDSIYIERRTTSSNYYRIAALKGDTSSFQDVYPFPNKYYYYRVIAHYDTGYDVYSHPARIFMPIYVQKVRNPFKGEPLSIPGIIEAEDFDLGGEGLTYHDSDGINMAGDYRPDEGVDVYDRNGDGYHIGNAIPGEWYEYSVNISESGEYEVDVYLAAIEGGGKFIIKIGETESDTLYAAASYSRLDTKSTATTMNLMAGEQIMRFTVIEKPLFNIDKLIFRPAGSGTGLSESASGSLDVYQNQNREIIVHLKDGNTLQMVRMYDLKGSLVYSAAGAYSVIPAADIPAGMYIIRAAGHDRVYATKIWLR
jgi:aryl-phospho-beta-D-glucosidase BglC (GH1 family)